MCAYFIQNLPNKNPEHILKKSVFTTKVENKEQNPWTFMDGSVLHLARLT